MCSNIEKALLCGYLLLVIAGLLISRYNIFVLLWFRHFGDYKCVSNVDVFNDSLSSIYCLISWGAVLFHLYLLPFNVGVHVSMSSRINLSGQHIWYSCTFALIDSFIYFLNVFVVLRPNVVYLNLKVGDVRFLKSIRESSKVEHFEVWIFAWSIESHW